MTDFSIPRPSSGDIITLLLDDHRWMEALLRDLRIGAGDRDAARAAFAATLVAHSEGEEQAVYGRLVASADEVGPEEAEHGHEEHAEGLAALLELMECKGLTTKKFEDALEKLSAYINHHFAEEEITILGPALRDLPEKRRREIGAAWLAARGDMLDAGCGSIDQVRELVAAARKAGVIPAELPDQPED